ncbi:MAG: TerC family protein [Alphaproteobacteria bacterium]|jgi:YjbE family integral membrane protein|nr:TerC family protein [Alphaproteobacteria bacterium]
MTDAISADAWSWGLSLLEIIWVNILLSGDNAMVIAMACRSLPERQRRWGIICGAGAAVALRIIFTGALGYLLEVPYLKAIGAILLVIVAVKLAAAKDDEEQEVAAPDTLLRAVVTVVVADAVMSLDNVIAIAAAAHGSHVLMAIGLIISVPLVVAGSSLLMAVIDRVPLLVWAGAAFLGWIAGSMLVADQAILPWLPPNLPEIAVDAGAAVLVVVVAWAMLRLSAARQREIAD